nr:HD domain-containing phosphohydrolase [uncultured Methylotenera sp.]
MTSQTSDTNLNIIENIISASESSEFYLSEDVYDHAGNKLLGKGYKITPVIKDKLINRVLKKPLETSTSSDSSLTAQDIYLEAESLINSNPFLQSFDAELKSDASAIKSLTLAPLASLLLTVQRNNSKEAFEHTLFVILIARQIAKRLRYDASTTQDLTIASLLHDVGELYCVIPNTKNLSLEHWRSIMTHPIIGSSVVRQHMNYSANVYKAILEHHERNDGSGYPNHLSAERCSDIGKVLIVAEAFAGMVRKQYDLGNLITTLKLVNHDFPALQFNALIDLLSSLRKLENVKATNPILEHLLAQLKNIEEMIALLKALESSHSSLKELSNYLILRLSRICQTIYASGLTDCIELGMWDQIKLDEEVNHELFITINEVEWKLKDVFRDVSLRIIRDGIESGDEILKIIQKVKSGEQAVPVTP